MSDMKNIVTVITFTNKTLKLFVDLKCTNTEDIINYIITEYEYKCSEPYELIDFINMDTSEKLNSRYEPLSNLGLSGDCSLKMFVNYTSKTKNCYPSKSLVDDSNNSTFQIFVKCLDGKHCVIGLNKTMTILDIKKLLTLRTEFPHYSFHLLRKSRNRSRMEDERTVDDYMIEKEESFDMILRLRGGTVKEYFRDEECLCFSNNGLK